MFAEEEEALEESTEKVAELSADSDETPLKQPVSFFF